MKARCRIGGDASGFGGDEARGTARPCCRAVRHALKVPMTIAKAGEAIHSYGFCGSIFYAPVCLLRAMKGEVSGAERYDEPTRKGLVSFARLGRRLGSDRGLDVRERLLAGA